jgi:hypothetical protein
MAPSFVLAGSASEGQSLLRRLADGRGWVRTDAIASELRAALDAVPSARRSEAGRRAIATLSVVAVALHGIAAGLTWARLGVR